MRARVVEAGRRNIRLADVTPGAELRVAVVGSRLTSDVLGVVLIVIVLAVRSDGLTNAAVRIDINAVGNGSVRIEAARRIVAVEVAEAGNVARAGRFVIGILGKVFGESMRVDLVCILSDIGERLIPHILIII